MHALGIEVLGSCSAEVNQAVDPSVAVNPYRICIAHYTDMYIVSPLKVIIAAEYALKSPPRYPVEVDCRTA